MPDYDHLKKTLCGDVVQRGDEGYDAAIARWAANAQRNAQFVVFPKNDQDVVLALEFAVANEIPIAIKGGGHNPAGSSSVLDGLCIDLSRYLNSVSVDPESRLAFVDGGALWKSVDSAAIKHGLAVVGGTVNETGVGGLTLGGGYGWLSGSQGLSLDNLVRATIVTADGSILNVSETAHADLFWAIRGGGCNFGVVTKFVFRLSPQRRSVFAGQLIYPASLIDRVAALVDEWQLKATENETVVVVATRAPPPDRTPVIIIAPFYNGSAEEGRSIFKPFFDLGPILDMTSEMPYESLNAMINDNSPQGRNYYMSGTSLRSKLTPQLQSVFDKASALSSDPLYSITVLYEFFNFTKICAVPPDATAFRSRGPQPNIVVLVSWDAGIGDTADARAIAREITTLIESTAERAPRENENDAYGNYIAEADMPEKIHKLWGENYPRLQQIKKKYDPKMVFNRWFPIKPAA